MIGIVVALKSEANAFIEQIENVKEIKIADKPAFVGTFAGKEIVLIISGIGKVSAGLSAQLLIDKYSPNYIINFGTCGGMNKSVEILKYYLITKCCQFDFDLREIDNVPLGYIQEYKTAFFPTYTDRLEFLPQSILATADRFTNDMRDIDTINRLGASVRDMEGGAIAQVCTSNGVRLVMIKGISDVTGSGTAQEQFFKNLKTVADGFPSVIKSVVEKLN
ncbi:MAG: 5'-methylthioadenosine/S-adenosylhomocysteine nucleosidase [Clostridia bacterium]|nr:5'-methylthioadenosine/S-adenosylhomocysteine nucleosidase [Clostridia bacterium]